MPEQLGTVSEEAETKNGARAGADANTGGNPVAGTHTCVAPGAASAATHSVPLAAARAR